LEICKLPDWQKQAISVDGGDGIFKNEFRPSQMSHTIRTMTIADYEAVLRLWQATEGVGLNESDEREPMAAYLKRNPDLSQVALDGGKIVGAVLCGHDGRRGYLHHLAVARTHRKRGLGRALVDACLAGLAKLGIPKCNIFLFADNAEGEAFWKHNGWAKRTDLQMMQKVIEEAGQKLKRAGLETGAPRAADRT
jgi:GNAT superfamily N-acetyltransferase